MKQYKFELIVDEGNDEFWEELERENKTGCEDLMELITEALSTTGIGVSVVLREFTNKGN